MALPGRCTENIRMPGTLIRIFEQAAEAEKATRKNRRQEAQAF